MKPGGGVSMRDLVEYCKLNMSYFMVPRFLVVVESLPRTPNGKVEKFKLVEFAEKNRNELWDREEAGIAVTR
jgi:crotonobetaine/carnitine-CoA ligase